VECKMDKERQLGIIRCSVCDASFQMMTNYLTEAVDVYSEWLDQCEITNLAREETNEPEEDS